MALLEETGVALVHGTAFGLPGHFRVSYAASDAQLAVGAWTGSKRFCTGTREPVHLQAKKEAPSEDGALIEGQSLNLSSLRPRRGRRIRRRSFEQGPREEDTSPVRCHEQGA